MSICVVFLCCGASSIQAQYAAPVADYIGYQQQQQQKDYLNKWVQKSCTEPFNKNDAEQYADVLDVITQFLLQDSCISTFLVQLLAHYPELPADTKFALLETVHAIHPPEVLPYITQIITTEPDLKRFFMMATYLQRFAPPIFNRLTTSIHQRLAVPDSANRHLQAAAQLYVEATTTATSLPLHQSELDSLFKRNANKRVKVIYVFQSPERQHAGVAVVQQADGRFVRDSAGYVQTFQLLARAASGMPWFITHGNTPQGVYAITGIGVSHNRLIGPTPNIQLLLPFENDSLYYGNRITTDSAKKQAYQQLLPAAWQSHPAMWEAFYAGQAGRGSIIVHGSTISPDYFIGQSFHPFIPTMGCISGSETWSVFNGRLLSSEVLNLVNAFAATTPAIGWLYVVDVPQKAGVQLAAWITQVISIYEKTIAR